tara:strand:- start:1502 stop:1711 length:210 start_codon:yes stop_codon:yes gene_type:complete
MDKKMRKYSFIICWIITIGLLLYSMNIIRDFNCNMDNLKDTSELLLIDSLQLEIMEIGAELDSLNLINQ